MADDSDDYTFDMKDVGVFDHDRLHDVIGRMEFN